MMNFTNSYRKYVSGLEQINQAAKNHTKDFINQIEKSFQMELSNIASFVLNSERCKIIMITGPSSSGKTTSANILRKMITQMGRKSDIISLDNFFLGKNNVPIDENGNPDFDSINAIDVKKVKHCIKELINNGECILPTYDFINMKPGNEMLNMKISKDSVVIIEGIHALNPILIPNVDPECIVKVYIDVEQGIDCSSEQILSSLDIRFIRRVVRDFKYRASTVENTAKMWESVCRNASIYINPFKESSDFTINSIHLYEPCVFLNIAVPLLEKVNISSQYYDYISKLVFALKRFQKISDGLVPSTSLLKEFL